MEIVIGAILVARHCKRRPSSLRLIVARIEIAYSPNSLTHMNYLTSIKKLLGKWKISVLFTFYFPRKGLDVFHQPRKGTQLRLRCRMTQGTSMIDGYHKVREIGFRFSSVSIWSRHLESRLPDLTAPESQH